MTTQKITTTILSSAVLVLPLLAAAHGGIDDSHIEEAMPTMHRSGSSELLRAWSLRWWGLLAVSSLLTTGLSFLVWKYMQVEVPKKTDAKAAEAEKK